MLRLLSVLLIAACLHGCSGSIYRQQPIKGTTPVAIAVDARQRILLSQLDDPRGKTADDPSYRRFCAEPSPDVFTVLGVSGSGVGNLGLGADKSVSAALQAAFSSSETGATIARTQTLNMLREMMFRTCERYLSGAISSEEFPIIAARDQRVMVSILAIEQLTGSITPRALSIGSGGSASTGLNPTEMLKVLTEANAAIKTADDDLAAKAKKQTEADAPGGTCATLRQKKATGAPALTTDETNKLKACDDADTAHATAKSKRDAAQSHYDALVAASKGGIGISSASTTGSVTFAGDTQRPQSISAVADVVDDIVRMTFQQDETQLFCIRTLYGASGKLSGEDLKEGCRDYLLTRIRAEQNELAREYGLPLLQVEQVQAGGRGYRERRERVSPRLNACAANAEGAAGMQAALAADASVASLSQPLVEAAKRSERAVYNFLEDLGAGAEDRVLEVLTPICGLGGL